MASSQLDYKTEFANSFLARGEAKGLVKGKAESKAEAVIRLLKNRGLSITEEQRAEIAGCTDLARLDEWFDCAFDAKTADEVFGSRKTY